MFTGIITDVGTIQQRITNGDVRFTISCAYDYTTIAIGASIACSGVCLTVVETGCDASWGDWFAVEVSQETLSRTVLGAWHMGTEVNLERSLKMGDELGGHLVSGHVDGIGMVNSREVVGDCVRFTVSCPENLLPLVAEKGSICIDGVSLTINSVDANALSINIIPHTLSSTTLNTLQKGDKVNLEVDLIARYVQRLMGQGEQ